VQHVGAYGVRDVRAVVDRQERAVPPAGGAEHREVLQLLPCFEALLAELDDVDTAAQRGVEEVRQVALGLARVGAQVEPRPAEPCPEGDRPVRGKTRGQTGILRRAGRNRPGSKRERLRAPVDLLDAVLGERLHRRTRE
jgi:hypothetical protein